MIIIFLPRRTQGKELRSFLQVIPVCLLSCCKTEKEENVREWRGWRKKRKGNRVWERMIQKTCSEALLLWHLYRDVLENWHFYVVFPCLEMVTYSLKALPKKNPPSMMLDERISPIKTNLPDVAKQGCSPLPACVGSSHEAVNPAWTHWPGISS